MEDLIKFEDSEPRSIAERVRSHFSNSSSHGVGTSQAAAMAASSSSSMEFRYPQQMDEAGRRSPAQMYGGEFPRSPQQMNIQPSKSAERASSSDILSDGTEESQLYVNAKQFHRILKRRVARQRLEEVLRLASRNRKPYLHESRHGNQTRRRPRGPGGRFLTADEVAEMERKKAENKGENEETPTVNVHEQPKPQHFQAETASRDSRQRIPSTPDPETIMIGPNSLAQRESNPADVSTHERQVAIPSSPAAVTGEALLDASHVNARSRTLTRSRSPSQTRSMSSSGSTVGFMATPRSGSTDTAEGRILDRSGTRSNLEIEEEDSWSSELDENIPQKPHILTGDRRNRVEQVMETFWEVMNKSWKHRIYEMTRTPGETGSSRITNGSASQSTEASSSLIGPSQKSLGKRPASNNEKDNEERQPKRNRDDSNVPADASEKIKYACPYRKHDRQRYNVHTHRICVLTGFPDISRLK
jgi:hypothetical protein